MNALAVNGSPRKTWNTATLLKKALAGARSRGAETEIIHLYDVAFKGCISCFACKKIGGKSYGRCAVKDELTPVLQKAVQADLLILGSPMYLHAESGEMRSFMERLLFPYVTYTPDHACIFPRKIPAAFVYTMNVTEENMPLYFQDKAVASTRGIMIRVFGSCEILLATDTCQFNVTWKSTPYGRGDVDWLRRSRMGLDKGPLTAISDLELLPQRREGGESSEQVS